MQRISGVSNYGFVDLGEPAPDYEVEPPPDYDELVNKVADVITFNSYPGLQNTVEEADSARGVEGHEHPYKWTPTTAKLQIAKEEYDTTKESKVLKGKQNVKKNKKQSKKQANSKGINSNVLESNDLREPGVGEQIPADAAPSGVPQLDIYPGYGINDTSGASLSEFNRYSTQLPITTHNVTAPHAPELHGNNDRYIETTLIPATATAIATGIQGQTMPPKDKDKGAKKNKAKEDKNKKSDPSVQAGDAHDVEKGNSTEKADSKEEVDDNCCVRCCKCYGSFSKGCCKCWAKCCCKCSCCVCSGLCCSITIPLLVIACIIVIVVVVFVYVV